MGGGSARIHPPSCTARVKHAAKALSYTCRPPLLSGTTSIASSLCPGSVSPGLFCTLLSASQTLLVYPSWTVNASQQMAWYFFLHPGSWIPRCKNWKQTERQNQPPEKGIARIVQVKQLTYHISAPQNKTLTLKLFSFFFLL